jgi:N-acetylglucosamine kinase
MFGAIIGTGAGGGYCVNGRLLRGANGIAGEWGHWPVPAALLQQYQLPLLPCACGRSGCMERYVSGPGMSQLTAIWAATARRRMPSRRRLQPVRNWLQQTLALHLDLLAHALAALVITLDPHAIVLGGGLSQMSHLYQQLPAAVKRHLFTGVIVPPILPPAYGDAGGARGAALLARQLYP